MFGFECYTKSAETMTEQNRLQISAQDGRSRADLLKVYGRFSEAGLSDLLDGAKQKFGPACLFDSVSKLVMVSQKIAASTPQMDLLPAATAFLVRFLWCRQVFGATDPYISNSALRAELNLCCLAVKFSQHAASVFRYEGGTIEQRLMEKLMADPMYVIVLEVESSSENVAKSSSWRRRARRSSTRPWSG